VEHEESVPEHVVHGLEQALHNLSVESPYWPEGHGDTQLVELKK
jgi:hypothetical protein